MVAPALARSRLEHWLASDSERRQEEAAARLDESLRAFEAAGMNARGHLGDQDPIQALDDALRVFDPDEIVISTHPPARSNWLEKQIVRKARERYSVPVTHVVVDLEHESTTHARGRCAPAADGRARAPPAGLPRQRLRRRARDPELRLPRPAGAGVRRRAGCGSATGPPADAADDAWVVFAVDVPEEVAEGYERGTGPEGRRFLLPAELLNRHGPPIAEGDWSE